MFGAFEIITHGVVKVNLYDSTGIKIRKDKLLQHIRAFWRDSSFTIAFEYEGEEAGNANVMMVTPQVIVHNDSLQCKERMLYH